jgi:cell division protein ZipA
LVLGAHPYDAATIRNALIAQGMTYDEQKAIFVLCNDEGEIYLRAANAWNPGTIPPDNDPNFQTPGVALILQLPTCIHAPRAMDDMIRVARKLHQRLNARLYSMDRKPLSESDIRAMRKAAVEYVSAPLK